MKPMHLSSSPRQPSTCATRAWFRMEKRTDQLEQRPDYILIERVRPRKEVDNCCSRKRRFRGRSPSKRDQNARARQKDQLRTRRERISGVPNPQIDDSLRDYPLVLSFRFRIDHLLFGYRIGKLNHDRFDRHFNVSEYSQPSSIQSCFAIAYKHTRLQAKRPVKSPTTRRTWPTHKLPIHRAGRPCRRSCTSARLFPFPRPSSRPCRSSECPRP